MKTLLKSLEQEHERLIELGARDSAADIRSAIDGIRYLDTHFKHRPFSLTDLKSEQQKLRRQGVSDTLTDVTAAIGVIENYARKHPSSVKLIGYHKNPSRRAPRKTAASARKFTSKAKTAKRKRQWAHTYESARKRGYSEGRAIQQASGVVAKSLSPRRRGKSVRTRKNPVFGKRKSQTHIIEAVHLKPLKFWYWNGHAVEDKRTHAFVFPTRAAAYDKAKEIRNRLPSGFKVLRVIPQ